ncbi:MAG: Serine-tRNA ligase [Candidatus Curtissbacteria bacterium GW2011_GWA1_40_16]|uniref:Serine--tRNA ligase n=1 Tax=Candidatus Curtissbacteria bacterium GW2011_GWA1_40_16 TaxID=1618405 RepID=A0A0G0RFX7_9BACT|nr:MAG: Serine-tRNA ligase [Candidatus Curtissbacteria bacterium GW2011_GWA1_40_16]
MLDIKFIRENAKLVKEKSKQKGYDVDVDKLLKVDEDRRKLIEEVDQLRSSRKKAADARDEKKGSQIKTELKSKEDKLEKLQEEYYQLIRQIPNPAKDDVPIGDESKKVVVRQVGEKPKFGFEPKDHLSLGLSLDLIDVERASKISGTRFAFLKNELVSLEFALVSYVFEKLNGEEFIPVVPPVLVNKKAVNGLGYPEYENGEGYKVDDQYLVGTAEHSIVPMHMDETFNLSDLPKRYAAFSTAFRREAGSYGKDTKGIFRVHQFDKVEMVSFTTPDKEDKEHQFLLSLEEKFVSDLGLVYQVVNIASGDLGFPASRKFDIETWLPSQNQYRETHSVSTTGDFQARRLNIKYKEGDHTNYVSILNGTAFAIGRTLIAIMENYQQKDGSILVPKALQKYTGFTKIPA